MQRELAKGEVARIKVSQLETERKELREQLEAAKERAERFVKNKKKKIYESLYLKYVEYYFGRIK